MPSPPGPDQILTVPAGKSATYRTWRWLDALALNDDDREGWQQYIFKRTGTVQVRARAPGTTFEVKQLARDAKDL